MADLESSANRVMVLQVVMTAVLVSSITVYTAVYGDDGANPFGLALAAGYGGLIGIASTWLSRRSVDRATKAARETTSLAMVPVYVGLLNKFLVVGGGLAVGLIALRLNPLSVVAGFIVSQLALVVIMIRPGRPLP